ncbi:MAG: hypothetical protein AAFV53_11785 [Myxococcota bacterium]
MESAVTAHYTTEEAPTRASVKKTPKPKYVEEDLFDRMLPTLLCTLYFCAGTAAVIMGLI